MNNNELKKKIIYRSNYRGSKEMDLLISSFVKKVINSINKKQLIQLNELVALDDETLFRLNREPNKNKTNREPDYYLHKTDKWLVFPHELEGLTKQEMIDFKPELSDIVQKIKF